MPGRRGSRARLLFARLALMLPCRQARRRSGGWIGAVLGANGQSTRADERTQGEMRRPRLEIRWGTRDA